MNEKSDIKNEEEKASVIKTQHISMSDTIKHRLSIILRPFRECYNEKNVDIFYF